MQVLRRELDMVKREKKEKKEFLSNFFKDDNEDIVGGVFQLKQSLHEFLRCRIGNGRTASFCYDSWTELGPMGISWVLWNQCNFAYSGMDCFKRNTSWKLYFPQRTFSECRNYIRFLCDDVYLWRGPARNFLNRFSSKVTW